MRKIKLVFLFLPIFIVAQANALDNVPILKEIVTVDNTSKDELYNRGKIWFARSFKSSMDVVQLDDKENGKIIGKGIISFENPGLKIGKNASGYFEFMITIDIKQNKFRYTIENIRHESYKDNNSGGLFTNEKPECGTFIMPKSNWKRIKEIGYSEIEKIIQDLKFAMNKASTPDDW